MGLRRGIHVNAWVVSRRLFLAHAASVAALFGVARQGVAHSLAAAASSKVPAREPVVSFHMDQPYLDMTGTAVPYIPPAGTRSGQPLAKLSAEEFYACFR
jgi:hypothetical protein